MKNFSKKLSTLFLAGFLGIIIVIGLTPAVLAQTQGGSPVSILNPLRYGCLFTGQGCDEGLINAIISMLVWMLMPIAMIIFVWTAIKMIRAASEGNEQKITESKKALLWAFIGLCAIVMANGLVNIIKSYFLEK